MEKIRCSVPILTLNVRHSLETLLPELITLFDDVYLMDGNSTDGTVEYARSLGIRVQKQYETDERNVHIRDFAEVRMRSWQFARYDWILVFDADERRTPEFVEMVRGIVHKNQQQEAHWFRRIPVIHGVAIRRTPFYSAHYMRLFTRSSGVFIAPRLVHERFVIPNTIHSVLHEEVILCPESSPDQIRARHGRYIELEAQSLHDPRWHYLLQWILWYNARSLLGQFVCVCAAQMLNLFHREPSLPWSCNLVFFEYRWRSMREGVYAWCRLRKK